MWRVYPPYVLEETDSVMDKNTMETPGLPAPAFCTCALCARPSLRLWPPGAVDGHDELHEGHAPGASEVQFEFVQ